MHGSILILLLRIGGCDIRPETHSPVVSFTREFYVNIEKELGLPATYLSHMTSDLIRTSSFSTYKENRD